MNGPDAGIALATLLTLIFVGLKVTDHVGWSWWWVLSPTLAAAALVVIVLAVIVVLAIKEEDNA